MKNKILKIAKKPFVRNVVILSSGTAAAQVIGVALSPIITRIYGPEAYGLMGTFIALVSFFAPIAALTFPIAIVLPQREKDAKGLIRLSLLIAVLFSIVVGLLIILFHEPIVRVFQLEDINSYLYLIPVVILSAGLLQVMEQWLIRTKQFTISAKVTFLQALIVNGGKVGIGLVHPFASVLILFTALTQGLKAILMHLFTRKTSYKLPSDIIKDRTSIRGIIKDYKDFPLYRAPQTIVNSISEGIPVLMMASFFGPAAVGFYNIGRTVLGVPTQLIGKSVGDVFYPKIARVANDGISVTQVLKKATLILAGIGILPYGVVIIFGPILFSFVFGSEWTEAGEYARWISLWSFSSFILQPALRALPVILAQKFHLIFTIISVIIRISLLLLGSIIFSSEIIAIALFCASSGLLNILLMLSIFSLCKKFDNKKIRTNL
ncbi:lipopolysaccharide biosynthesis protein [Oceanobacillus saliphilus]|uniref:lipopolysaccharide biosynthesis protein n=1 Tax=Oceanobacillus saliphilus TaxID=2925834 RepID=UPI00201E5023|nr:oligosaccharide flippase family protein [Oceanobacillus saliphilus]